MNRPLHQRTDADLIASSRQGEGAAFDELAKRYQGLVRQVVRRYAAAPHEDDLAQQALWTAYSRLDRLRDPGRFQAWLWGITARLCWKWSRATARRAERGEVPLEDLHRDPEFESLDLDRHELRERITRSLAALPERWQAPLMLRYLDGLSVAEIAESLERSQGSVRGALARGTRALRERLRVVWNELCPSCALDEAAPELLPTSIEEILGSHNTPVMVLAEDHTILATNQPYSRETGFEADAVRGRRCYEISHGRDRPCDGSDHPCPMRIIGSHRRQASVVHHHRRTDGTMQEVEVVMMPVDVPEEEGRSRRYWIEFLHPVEASDGGTRDMSGDKAGRVENLHDDPR